MVRCGDGSVYTGITTDVSRRMAEHRSGSGRGACYTRMRGISSLDGLWTAADRPSASRLEYRIKCLSRAEKDALLACPDQAARLDPDDDHEAVDAIERDRLWQESLRRS